MRKRLNLNIEYLLLASFLIKTGGFLDALVRILTIKRASRPVLLHSNQLKMKILTKGIIEKFRKNLEIPKSQRRPIIKIYSPCRPIKYLLSEYDPKTKTFYGILDIGFGCPSKGWIDLDTMIHVSRETKLPLKRDTSFIARKTIDQYDKAALYEGQINA